MLDGAHTAARRLELAGIPVRVLNVFTLKPIDRDVIVSAAEEAGAVVTAETTTS